MKIIRHSHKQLYKQPKILKRLDELMNSRFRGSAMREDIYNRRAGQAFIAREGKSIMGWAWVSRRRHDSALQISVFVDPDFRKKGIGTKLTLKAKQYALKKKKRLYYSHQYSFSDQMYTNCKLTGGFYDWLDNGYDFE